MPDAEVLAACSRQDPRAWRELVRRYRRLVYGMPQALGLQWADAEEVFQQTFSTLLQALPRLQQPERLEAWLVTTSRRISIRMLRAERRHRQLTEANMLSVPLPANPPDPACLVEELRAGERIQRAVESLGDPCATILLGLFATPPRPYREIARELGLATGSMGATRARCLDRLRTRLRRDLGAAIPAGPRPARGPR
jgi:RNA polymerase sigma factor (sigma-70 family)